MEFTAVIHDCRLDGETGFAATCAEFPEANGQGETVEECLDDLRQAIDCIVDYRRKSADKSLNPGEYLQPMSA